LAHIAGVKENPDGPWWELGFSATAEELFGNGTQQLMTAPSTYRTHHYSNLGYALIGWMLERITGKPWPTLLKESLLDPLELTRTSLEPSEPYAIGHVAHPWDDTAARVAPSDTGAMAPAGQLWSSVGDLLRWGRCLLGDTEHVLRARTAAEMRSLVAMCDGRWREAQGTGLQLWRQNEFVCAGHGGSVPGFCAALMTHAPTGTVAAVCANSSRLADADPASIGLEILQSAVKQTPQTRPAWRASEAPPEEVRTLMGRWWAATTEYEVTYNRRASTLAIAPCEDPSVVSTFRRGIEGGWRGCSGPAAGEALQIEREPDGDVTGLALGGVVFRRVPYVEM
jgi:CubicO group peptidase (beta-lactamase class C family)